MRALALVLGLIILGASPAVAQNARCEIPRQARDIWRCEKGFVIGPGNVIIGLPIAETDPEALYKEGLAAAQREDWRVAIAYFTAAHQRAHLVPRYMYNLGLAHARAGHPPAAIAWLTTYLIADPSAPNRSSVWQEIAALERATREQVDAIYKGAESAAALLPPNATESGMPRGVRSQAYLSLAWAAANARDMSRAQRFLSLSDAAAVQLSSLDRPLAQNAEVAALEDGDLAAAEAIARGLGRPIVRYSPEFAARLRKGLLNVDLCRSAYQRSTGDLHRSMCSPPLYESVYQSEASIYEAMQSADRTRLKTALAARHERQYLWGPLALAVGGRGDEALRTIARDNGLLAASLVAEGLLRTGSAAEAEPFVRLTERLARESDNHNGWGAAMVRALSMAEQGQVEQSIELLDIALARNLVARRNTWGISEAEVPVATWMVSEYDGRVFIVEFLIDRGRQDAALAAIARLDTLRQLRVAEHARARGKDANAAFARLAAEALEKATAGAEISSERRRPIEDAIVVATTIPGIGYDPQEWLAATSSGVMLRDSSDARGRASLLAIAGEGLQRGVLRARAMYQRAGGTWGR